MNAKHLPSNLYPVLQSFLTLGRTLNLSKTTAELNITRQSVRRHVSQLEELTGSKLFTYQNNQYALTVSGSRWMAEIASIVEQTSMLFDTSSTVINGMPSVHVQLTENHHFFAQQHPIVDVWQKSTPSLIRKGLDAWARSQSALEHEAMNVVRPYLVVCREFKNQWIRTEIGEKSSYAKWTGATWSKSAIGQVYEDDPIKTGADSFLLKSHNMVARTGAPWYDHISTKFPNVESGELVPVNYQKLVLPCHYPNGMPAIAVLIAHTNNISIDGLDPSDIPDCPKKYLMEFEI